MKKLLPVTVLSILFLVGCGDYSVDLGRGYSYEHWGNNFIAHTDGDSMRQVIPGQVDHYVVQDNTLLAIQVPFSQEPRRYWVVDMQTDQLKNFDDRQQFLSQANKLGIPAKVIEEF